VIILDGGRYSKIEEGLRRMQITLTVNKGKTIKGAIKGRGILSANVSLFVPTDSGATTAKAKIHGFDSSRSSEWSVDEISVGDTIEIRLMPDDDADPPSETQEHSIAPRLLFTDINRARQALNAAHVCKDQLEGILRAARLVEPHDEALKIQNAIINVIQHLSSRLIRPTLGRHPDLLPEAKSLDLID